MRHEIELARILHDDQTAIQILQSKDGSRITICTLTKDSCSGWRVNGVTPSFPSVLIGSVIMGLQKARDGRDA
jgi:hypothetical protein